MEILSPAGDFESLQTALKNGADAVYIGGVSFSARKNAKNFTNEEIEKASDLCHLYRAKLYVACNILIKENELKDAVEYVKFLIKAGVDGIIVQDIGLLTAIREVSDDIKINVSTQATVCSSEGVNVFKELGANRVVLARELSFEEIKSIKGKTDTELEMFVHGALCMCWSGQCLLSSIIGGRSGNRGLCAQPCRLPYKLLLNGEAVTKKLPLLNTKDLCLADKISEIKEFADSAKIEGRMKSPEYTGVVTEIYKSASEEGVKEQEIEKMLSFFSRGGSSHGYYNGRSFEKMMDYYPNAEKVTADKQSKVEIKQKELKKVRPISFVLTANEGEPLKLKGKSEEFETESIGAVVEKAMKAPINEERLKAQIEKLGDTCFYAENTEIKTKGAPFVSASAINALRREVCQDIERKICASYKQKAKDIKLADKNIKRAHIVPKLSVSVRTKAQLDAARKSGADLIYMPYSLFSKFGKEGDFLLLPSVTKESEGKEVLSSENVVVQNIGQIPSVKGRNIIAGERMNITNSRTCETLKSLGVSRVTLSAELNIKEMSDILKNTDMETEIICYGRLPVMLMENCVIKSAYKCTKGEGSFELEDRLGQRFPVICEDCRNVVLNSVPIYMADKIQDILRLNPDGIKLMFSTESEEETAEIISLYKNAINKKEPKKSIDKITRGHFYRGVE